VLSIRGDYVLQYILEKEVNRLHECGVEDVFAFHWTTVVAFLTPEQINNFPADPEIGYRLTTISKDGFEKLLAEGFSYN